MNPSNTVSVANLIEEINQNKYEKTNRHLNAQQVAISPSTGKCSLYYRFMNEEDKDYLQSAQLALETEMKWGQSSVKYTVILIEKGDPDEGECRCLHERY